MVDLLRSIWFITYSKNGKKENKRESDYLKILKYYNSDTELKVVDYQFEVGKINGVHLHMIVEFAKKTPLKKKYSFPGFYSHWKKVFDMNSLKQYIHKGDLNKLKEKELIETLCYRTNYLLQDIQDPHYSDAQNPSRSA